MKFSLGYMLLELSLVAVALGLSVIQADDLRIVLGPVVMIAWGAAIGGLFGRIRSGAVVGLCLYPVIIIANLLGW